MIKFFASSFSKKNTIFYFSSASRRVISSQQSFSNDNKIEKAYTLTFDQIQGLCSFLGCDEMFTFNGTLRANAQYRLSFSSVLKKYRLNSSFNFFR